MIFMISAFCVGAILVIATAAFFLRSTNHVLDHERDRQLEADYREEFSAGA